MEIIEDIIYLEIIFLNPNGILPEWVGYGSCMAIYLPLYVIRWFTFDLSNCVCICAIITLSGPQENKNKLMKI